MILSHGWENYSKQWKLLSPTISKLFQRSEVKDLQTCEKHVTWTKPVAGVAPKTSLFWRSALKLHKTCTTSLDALRNVMFSHDEFHGKENSLSGGFFIHLLSSSASNLKTTTTSEVKTGLFRQEAKCKGVKPQLEEFLDIAASIPVVIRCSHLLRLVPQESQDKNVATQKGFAPLGFVVSIIYVVLENMISGAALLFLPETSVTDECELRVTSTRCWQRKLTTSCGATGVKRQDTNDTNDEDVKVANEDSPRLLVIEGCNVQRRSAIAFELCDISWAVKRTRHIH